MRFYDVDSRPVALDDDDRLTVTKSIPLLLPPLAGIFSVHRVIDNGRP